MRALVYESYGGPEVTSLRTVQKPQLGAGEVLIRTRAAGLNPVDAVQREGTFKMIDPYEFPKIGGNEVSGIVEAAGPGVRAFAAGDQVIAKVDGNKLGAFAELVVVPARWTAKAPESIELVDAAGLPLVGLTTQQALGPEHLDLQPDERLLITGASGGVGLIAIQLAKLAGAHVTVTASKESEELVRRMGADELIDYKSQSVTEAVENSGERFDKVFDLVGDDIPELFSAVRSGGTVVTLVGPPTPGSLTEVAKSSRTLLAAIAERVFSFKVRRRAAKAGVKFEFFLMHPDGAGLAELVRLIDEGKLEIIVDSRYPLEEYADAFERLESRHSKGKVLLEF